MVEHVGEANLPKYMETLDKLLVPGGISVLHCITGQIEGPCNRWINFMNKVNFLEKTIL